MTIAMLAEVRALMRLSRGLNAERFSANATVFGLALMPEELQIPHAEFLF
jgi:hypothetical protein